MLPRDTTGDTRNPSWSTRNKCVARAVRIRTYRPAVDLLYEIANTRDETRAEMRRDCDCDSEDGCRLLTRISSEGGGAGGRARHVAMVRDQATCTRPMAARAPRIAPRPRTAPPRARHRPCTAHGAVPTAWAARRAQHTARARPACPLADWPSLLAAINYFTYLSISKYTHVDNKCLLYWCHYLFFSTKMSSRFRVYFICKWHDSIKYLFCERSTLIARRSTAGWLYCIPHLSRFPNRYFYKIYQN